AEKISKRYRNREHERYHALRDVFTRALRSPLSFLRRSHPETFWALKEVSLDVREGEVLGLIGRNGAGKTTLLKILSRITRPTTGWAEIRGRVGSLLEPEILLVDEVLAVGDLEFQKKCLGKMGEVSKGGRTIVFVSHQIGQIRRLCERVIWIDRGAVKRDGEVLDVVSAYETASAER